MTIKRQQEGDLCGDGIVWYLDCGVGYRNLHVGQNGVTLYRHIHTRCINADFLLLLLYI